MITIFAPDGIGEITVDSDVAAEIIAAVDAHELGPLVDGDIMVVTSKIISKHEGRSVPAEEKPGLLVAETVRTVARRGARFVIVETRQGLVQAAAGIDSSNVAPGTILALPVDPDASAGRLLGRLQALTGARLGVIISDTSGRAWRTGQTDHAIGLAGVRPLLSYEGQTDTYGNDLLVTSMAVADELAGAADLAKSKLRRRPVAVIRGTGQLLAAGGRSAELLRPVSEDLFRLGTREAVIEAVAVAVGRVGDVEDLFKIGGDELVAELTGDLPAHQAELFAVMLRHADGSAPTA